MFEILKTTRTGRQMLRTATKTLGSASVVAALIGCAGGLGVAQTAGTLDPTFGTGGIVTTDPSLIGGNPNAPDGGVVGTLTAIEQSNGDLVVVTGINPTAIPNLEVFALVRYTSSLRYSAVQARWQIGHYLWQRRPGDDPAPRTLSHAVSSHSAAQRPDTGGRVCGRFGRA